jgi:hypothetical protein
MTSGAKGIKADRVEVRAYGAKGEYPENYKADTKAFYKQHSR